jgi:DHA3 family macrolide efflux protein-like MFS transporter
MSFAAPIGMFIAGPVSNYIGISNWMICAGVLMLINGFLCYILTREFDLT